MDFNKTVKKCYDKIIAKYPDAILYEARGVLKENTDGEVIPDASSVTCVFQLSAGKAGYVLAEEKKRIKVTKVDGYVVQDCVISPDCKLSLSDAFDAMHAADIIIPHSLYVTLRKPLSAHMKEYAQYIYGDTHHNPYVFIDSFTGEVELGE